MNPAPFLKTVRNIFLLIVPVALICSANVPPARASVPQLMTYQGLLKNSSGSYLTGTYSMTFRIYNASTGGTALWTETQSTVSVSSGSFSVQLGSVQALTLSFTEGYWLSVQVGADAEMTPRVRLTSVGYSYRSDEALNGFSQSQHDAMSHKNIEGVRDNTVAIAKTNFKLDAYSVASANNMGEMVVDSFNDATGIDSGTSSSYAWRGSPNYDVTGVGGGIDSYAKAVLHANGSNGSTTITDSSSAPHTFTANGNAQISTSQSKFGGASAYLDGSGDYLSSPNSSDFDFGSGNFTIDVWIRSNITGNDITIASKYSAAVGWIWYINNGVTPYIRLYYDGYNYSQVSTTQFAAGTWYHLAVVRNGSNILFFRDGTQVGSAQPANSTYNGAATNLVIGWDTGAAYFNGWVDELRISKGIARWTSNFTPPASEYSSSSSQPATVISGAFTLPTTPTEALVVGDETLNGGTITYSLSRNNGTTWTQCTKETVCSLSSQSSGTQLKWKAVINGDAELNAIAVAV